MASGRIVSAVFLCTTSLLCLALAACGGGQHEAENPRLMPEDRHRAPGESPPMESVDVPLTELSRAEVNRAVEAGLGRFLQQVEVEASIVDGKFEGFRVVRFTEPSEWKGVGILPGDVIVSINERKIERPEQAFEVFASLKTADALDVSYLRNDRMMVLSLPIVGAPEAPTSDTEGTGTAPAQSEEAPSKKAPSGESQAPKAKK